MRAAGRPARYCNAVTTTARARPTTDPAAAAGPPSLRHGERLTRDEFHRRYAAAAAGTKAELVEGVVHVHSHPAMPSPVSFDKHAEPHGRFSFWAGYYCLKTPGVRFGVEGSVFGDASNEAQPDVLLCRPEAVGGQTRLVTRNDKQYVASAPELAAEVSASTASLDLNAKLRAYQRGGVREYVVALTEQMPMRVRWMTLAGKLFAPTSPDPADGLLKSRVFPGLWLDADALLAGDLARLVAAIERGCATPEHAEFVSRLASAATT